MSDTAKGMLNAVLSNVGFTLLFLYSVWMRPMSGTDVFAWRMVSMLFALLALMSLTGAWPQARSFVRGLGRDVRRWLLLLLPTPILASQLWLFVWSPVNGEGLNVAMGYFLFPLAMMLGGRIWFKEYLNRLQKLAVLLAAAGVAWSLLRAGTFSWTTVWVAGTYPVYYLLRRRLGVPSLIGLAIDLAVIAPCMAVYLLTASDSPALVAEHTWLLLPIVLLGINSALAMHWNLQANRLLPVALFSMLSYLEPILLFAVSVLWLGEPLTAESLIGYGLIWAGLCVMVADGWLKMNAAKRRGVMA